MGRDDFSRPTMEALAKRVGYCCSNPDCRHSTVGANEISTKATSIGVAAHITAAASGGPRYDAALTTEQRCDISNGIWLCSNCAALIDKDPQKYSVPALRIWKEEAEEDSRMKLSHRQNLKGLATSFNPFLEIDLISLDRGKERKGFSMRNPVEIEDGRLVALPGTKHIIHWELFWQFELVIYNNSIVPAYNIKIENVGDIELAEFEILPKKNNIPSLQQRVLKIGFTDKLEGTQQEAEELLKPYYPKKLEGLKLRVSYYDEIRDEHVTYVEFKNGEFKSNKLVKD